jgi:hypothetical protein
MSSTDYKVSFGRVARTLIYEDSSGVICFGFDVSPSEEVSKGKWMIGLERPLDEFKRIARMGDEQLRAVWQKRLDLAFERTKQYLVSCGYLVKIWPDETN